MTDKFSKEEVKRVREEWDSIKKDLAKYISPEGELLDRNQGIIERTRDFILSERAKIIFGDKK